MVLREPGRPESGRALWASIGVLAVVPIAMMTALMGYFASKSPGKEVASVSVSVDRPFELSYVSSGEAERVWLDLSCTDCDPNAVQGTVVALDPSQKTIAKAKVEQPISGYTHTHREEGSRHTIWGHPFMNIPARPRGERVTITGRLEPEPMRVYRLGPIGLNEGLPLPRVTDVRVWVAP